MTEQSELKREQARLRAEVDALRARWLEVQADGRKLHVAAALSMSGLLAVLAGGALLGALGAWWGWW